MGIGQRRKRVALVQPDFIPGGGTEAVTAWAIETLKSDYSVSLLTFSPVNTANINDFYGTRIDEGEYAVINPRLPFFQNRLMRFAMARDHLMMRYCKSLNRDFDLFIGVGGGMDFGKRGIQYGAYAPASTLMKILGDKTATPGAYYLMKKTFMRACESLSGFSLDSLRGNVSLATSKWTGERMEEMYALQDYEVVYPPVNTPDVARRWEDREEAFLCVARIVPEKMVDQAIEILKRVREIGFPITLHIAGRPDDRRYFEKIQELQAANASWVFVYDVLPKDELVGLMDRCKYGINAASGEPAGIAAIEMLKAGCIVFVREGGGLPEIVDTPAVTYTDITDAVGKIVQVLGDSESQALLRERLDERARSCSTETFCLAIKRVVRQFFDEISENPNADQGSELDGSSHQNQEAAC